MFERYRRDYAAEVLRIVREKLRVDGFVSETYKPHELTNPDAIFSGNHRPWPKDHPQSAPLTAPASGAGMRLTAACNRV